MRGEDSGNLTLIHVLTLFPSLWDESKHPFPVWVRIVVRVWWAMLLKELLGLPFHLSDKHSFLFFFWAVFSLVWWKEWGNIRNHSGFASCPIQVKAREESLPHKLVCIAPSRFSEYNLKAMYINLS
jgi:hypothetical protein